MTSLYPCSNQLARYYGRRLRLHATTLVSRKNSDNAKRGKSDVTYPCPCTLTFLHLLPPTSPLSLFERWRRIVYIIARIYTHTYTHGEQKRQGENSIDVFSMRLKINLSPRARALSSLALGLRRDATRRDALLSRMETNYVFHVEERFSSLEASIDGGGGRGGGDSSTPGRHQHVATCLQPTARSIEPSSDERRGDDR